MTWFRPHHLVFFNPGTIKIRNTVMPCFANPTLPGHLPKAQTFLPHLLQDEPVFKRCLYLAGADIKVD